MQSLAMQSLPTVTLPNGLEIFCLKKHDATWVHEEVKGYLKHGIHLQPGDTVFDVGANIGIFTLYLNYLLKNDIKVYAFEPIPSTFKVLEQNLQRHNPVGLKALCCGLGQETQAIEFAYYPEATTISGVATTPTEGMEQVVRDVLMRHPEHAPFPGNLLRWVPIQWRSQVLDWTVKDYFRVESVTCQMRRLSEVVREAGIEQINLLKIDAEKSEMNVLLGIAEEDWDKIQQVVVEVHDVDRRLEQVISLFKDHGLSKIIVEQEPLFEGSETFNVYAMRN